MIKNIWRDYIARVRNHPLKKYGVIILQESIWSDCIARGQGVILIRFSISPILKLDPFLERSNPKVSKKVIKNEHYHQNLQKN